MKVESANFLIKLVHKHTHAHKVQHAIRRSNKHSRLYKQTLLLGWSQMGSVARLSYKQIMLVNIRDSGHFARMDIGLPEKLKPNRSILRLEFFLP